MTDVVDTVVTELKKSSLWSVRVYRGWPPTFTTYPVAGVRITSLPQLDAGGNVKALYRYGVTVDVWCKDRWGDCRSALATALKTLKTIQSNQVDIPEANGITHIVTEFYILGGS